MAGVHRSDDNEGSNEQTSGLNLLIFENSDRVLLAVGCSEAVSDEVSEPATPVRNISGRGVQWAANQISEWCPDSDESVESDQGEKYGFNGEEGDIMKSYNDVKAAYHLLIVTCDEGDGEDTVTDMEGDGDELKMTLQEKEITKLEVKMVTLNKQIGTLQYEINFPATWSSFPQHNKLQVFELWNKIKHTKLNIMKNISKTKSYTLKQVALIESKRYIPTLLARKLGDVKQRELDRLLLEEGLEFVSRYELELVSFDF